MRNESIDILCAITYIYRRKKLAIMCPVGRMQQSIKNFDIDKLAVMFNAPIGITYPNDAIWASENMMEPIVEGFGRIPDDSYPMVIGIEESDTEESLDELKNEFDMLYPIEERLKEEGYKTYPVYYVINNIEKFKDSNDFERDDDNIGEIARIKYNEFDLESFIKGVRDILNGKIREDEIPMLLLNYGDGDLEENKYIYESIGKEKILDTEFINEYLTEDNDHAIGIHAGYDNLDGTIEVLNSGSIPRSDINVGEMEFYDDTNFVLTIELIDGYYIFKQCEFVTSFSSYNILEDAGDLTEKLLDVILKYKK